MDKEKIHEIQRRYRERHREKINKKSRERRRIERIKDPEKYRKMERDWRAKNLEYCRQRSRESYQRNIEKQRQWAKKYTKKLREKVIVGYGGKCECCGENRFEFLALDHVNGGGNKARLSGQHTHTVYRDALKRNFPPDYRILCHNCNNALGFYGYCPHKFLKS